MKQAAIMPRFQPLGESKISRPERHPRTSSLDGKVAYMFVIVKDKYYNK
jgi:hypothetical protein